MIELKLNLKPLIRKLEISTRRMSSSELVGEYRTAFKGRGLDFTGYRLYTKADDASMIDWKASLRSNDLLVKILEEERFLKVFILFDISNKMLYSSTDKLKCEYAAELIASLSFTVLHAGDSVGLIMFNDKIVKQIPINLGSKQYYLIIKALSDPKYYGGKFNIISVLKSLMNMINKDSFVLIISDYIGIPPEWERLLSYLAGKCEISGIIIRDPVDNNLPADKNQIVVQDPYSESKLIIDPQYAKEEYDRVAFEQVERIRNSFGRINSGVLHLTTTQSFVIPLIKFLHERKRRWR
jgi:hypothetical protein